LEVISICSKESNAISGHNINKAMLV